MEKLSKFMISRLALRQQHGTDHPDPDVLTAFTEGHLSSRERAGVLEHLGRCPECREVLALTSVESDRPVLTASSEKQRAARWRRWHWAAAMAVACLVVAVVWRTASTRKSPERPPLSAPPSAAIKAPSVGAPQPVASNPQRAKVERRTKPLKALSAKQKVESASAEDKRTASETTVTAAAPSLPQADSAVQDRMPQAFTAGAVPSQLRLRRATGGSLGSLWSLSPSESTVGTVQRSEDGGKTWASVRVDGRSRFHALSATGREIWIGGAEGALFHSADDGAHWTPVTVSDGTTKLSDAITRIDAHDGGVVRLRAQGGSDWVTADSGLHWRPE